MAEIKLRIALTPPSNNETFDVHYHNLREIYAPIGEAEERDVLQIACLNYRQIYKAVAREVLLFSKN